MNKSISILSLLLGLFVCFPFLSSCGDDDDNNPLLGVWRVTLKYGWSKKRTFNTDYTFTDRDYRNDNLRAEINGKYKIEDNKLTLLFDDHYTYLADHYSPDARISGTYTFVIEGSKLIIYDERTWTKSK